MRHPRIDLTVVPGLVRDGSWAHTMRNVTLLAAWVRTIGHDDQLVVAADSRLTGGLCWDGCPKIVSLPRTDCLLAFAGDTHLSYPLMLQVQNAFASSPALRSRRIDVRGARDNALLVVNQMKQAIEQWPSDGERDYSDTVFLLAGYSWRLSRFEVWRFVYRRRYRRFEFEPARAIRGLGDDRLIVFAGDQTSRATTRLARHLDAKGVLERGPVDMEPLSALIDLSLDDTPTTHSIGGAPQVAKIYRHQNVDHFAVRWPPTSSETYFFGRKLLPVERIDAPELSLIDGFQINYRGALSSTRPDLVAPDAAIEAGLQESQLDAPTNL